jgi:branched-chain amino acid transport system substrate-binding protein
MGTALVRRHALRPDSALCSYAEKVFTASYEVTDPTIDSQAISLEISGADVLISAATPTFAAQIIRKAADMNWKPLHLLTNVSTSVGAGMEPAGVERGTG